MKTKLLTIFPVVLVLSVLLTIPTISLAYSDNPPNDNVTYDEAENAALYYIDKFSSSDLPEWYDSKISSSVIYYSVNMIKTAYEFSITKDNKEAGFIVISANKNMMPVLEWGTGKAPSNYLPYIKEIAIDEGQILNKDISDLNANILYWGALSYSVQLGDKMVRDGISYHLPTGDILQVPKEQPELQMDKTLAQEAWAALNQEKGLLDADTNEISGVPAYFQSASSSPYCDEGDDEEAEYPSCCGIADDYWDNWDGCGPIAGAMVLGYWDSHGYSNLSGDDEILIDHCHYQMNTSDSGATSASDTADGIEAVSQLYSYDFETSWLSSNYWASFVGEVDAGRPFVLILDGHPTYDEHSVCGWGYYADEFIWSIGVYDTWDTSEHWITFLNWDNAWILKVVPGS